MRTSKKTRRKIRKQNESKRIEEKKIANKTFLDSQQIQLTLILRCIENKTTNSPEKNEKKE
jgi:hypothetical protein